MTTIKLSDPRKLGPAIRLLAKQMDQAALRALRKTARYGATMAVKVSASSRLRPRASGTYERSFTVVKLLDGALMTNTAKHAIFVEIGRRPGKRPPLKAIEDWVKLKRIARGSRAKRIALAVQRKIGKRGTKGRYVIKRTLPLMAKRLPAEMAREMQRAVDRAASRSKG